MAFVLTDTFLPATLNAPPMTDDEFASFCAEHPDLFFEMTAGGELVVSAPTFSLTGMRNTEMLFQLEQWSSKDARGGVTGSSDGFVLPNGARRSPDAAWTLKTRISQLSAKSLWGFWHLCPDYVIELKSDSDRMPVVRRKMNEWIANDVFRPNREPETFAGIESLKGEGPVEGFVLDLQPVWNPLL